MTAHIPTWIMPLHADPNRPRMTLPTFPATDRTVRGRREIVMQTMLDVAAEHHVKATDIAGKVRQAPIVAARWEVWRRLRDLGWSMAEIGRRTGHDHTSVMHGLGRLAEGPQQ